MRVLIIGGNGYVGAPLAMHLMERGHEVTVYDIRPVEWLAVYTGDGIGYAIRGDVRNIPYLREAMIQQDAIIHLACISNDPASELDPALTRSINLDCFQPCVEAARDAGIKRFIYASSSSVYGIKTETDVTEGLPLEPLTDYSRYKTECEKILLEHKGNMEGIIVRPATVCGWSVNMRLDLLVHILTVSALKNGVIRVFGGSQYRPNIYMADLLTVYELLLRVDKIDGEIFNAGFHNLTILQTAEMVRNVIGQHVRIEVEPSTDARSYHVSSQKLADMLHYTPYRPIGTAIMELRDAWNSGLIGDDTDAKYHRIKGVKEMFGG